MIESRKNPVKVFFPILSTFLLMGILTSCQPLGLKGETLEVETATVEAKEDQGQLEQGPNLQEGEGPPFQSEIKGVLEEKIKAEEEAGMYVLKGQIKKLNYEELLQEQGIEDPNPKKKKSHETYYILVLKYPRKLTFLDEMNQRSLRLTKMIRLLDLVNPELYLGREILLSVNPMETHWPSDSSLPLEEPRTAAFKILDERL